MMTNNTVLLIKNYGTGLVLDYVCKPDLKLGFIFEENLVTNSLNYKCIQYQEKSCFIRNIKADTYDLLFTELNKIIKESFIYYKYKHNSIKHSVTLKQENLVLFIEPTIENQTELELKFAIGVDLKSLNYRN